ncbi:MAG: orotidine-5'-phosphate decarboxylase [Proteobacteria bacterium]|jgi:orotidine 5''-phosphate decarboxylase, subfamily 1|nr:MAG: orotidine-5'-phosphate decarboxylase [Pseudomonadota bacterium]
MAEQSATREEIKNALIVALDVPSYEDASAIVSELGDAVSFYKIGLELLFDGGLRLAHELRDAGKLVFLDMKLLDIGNTVEKAVRNIARLGVNYLTIHAVDGKTLRAAKEGKGASELKLLGVTVLTSLTKEDLAEQGISESPQELVLRRARMAHTIGIDGVIASGLEARAIREAVGSDFTIITPGIRPVGSAANDQARAMTPRDAILAGANHLVVGRPVLNAPDRKMAALAIQDEIRDAFSTLKQ